MAGSEGGDEDGATRAFEDLRTEVSSMRRAVERLAAEHTGYGHAPDYSETLGVIANNITATAERVDMLVSSPALSLTPEEIGRQIRTASFDARREDNRQFAAARQGMDETTAKVVRHLESHVMANEQRRRLRRVGLAGLAAGMALWAIFAGPIVRALPSGWLMPERMAARSLRLPMWEGGQQLMRAASPESFAGVLAGNRLATANRETLEACRKQAARAKKAVRCAIEVETEQERR